MSIELLKAAKTGNMKKVIELIESYHVDINYKDKIAWLEEEASEETSTALHHAAQNLHRDIVEYLIKKGADVNAISSIRHWTPLHAVACNNPHKRISSEGSEKAVSITQLLLDNGADPHAKYSTLRGKFTAYELAKKGGTNAILSILLKAMTQKEIGSADTFRLTVELTSNEKMQVVSLLSSLISKRAPHVDNHFRIKTQTNGSIFVYANKCLHIAHLGAEIKSILEDCRQSIQVQFQSQEFYGLHPVPLANLTAINLAELSRYVSDSVFEINQKIKKIEDERQEILSDSVLLKNNFNYLEQAKSHYKQGKNFFKQAKDVSDNNNSDIKTSFYDDAKKEFEKSRAQFCFFTSLSDTEETHRKNKLHKIHKYEYDCIPPSDFVIS